jgi:hypothetical protein
MFRRFVKRIPVGAALADRAGRVLLTAALVLLLLAAGMQLLMQNDAVRQWISGAERREGTPLGSADLFCIPARSVV